MAFSMAVQHQGRPCLSTLPRPAGRGNKRKPGPPEHAMAEGRQGCLTLQ